MTPRLRQLPLFYSPALLSALANVSAETLAIAEQLHRRVLADGRSWLEVALDESTAEAAELGDVLGGSILRRAVRARHAAWRTAAEDGAPYQVIARAWRVCVPTVVRGVTGDRRRAAVAAELHQAVELHVAGELAERAA
jgi:hypothetical protein